MTLPQSIEDYYRAIALNPQVAELHYNLGHLLKRRGQSEEAIACFRRAIDLRDDFPEAYNNLGNALRERNLPQESIEVFQTLLLKRPDFALGWNNLGVALKDVGRLHEAIAAFDRSLAIDPNNPAIASNRLGILYFHPDFDSQRIYREHQLWNEKFAAPLFPAKLQHPNDPSPNRRLRIGYVSPYFRLHCQALFTWPLFANHNHEQFEIFCYSDAVNSDGYTEQLQSKIDQWRNIAGLLDNRVAEIIRSDKIDILIDLSLHLAGHRLLVFARKPAPVQVSWLGYPGTTGLSAIDYRFTDPHLDPLPPSPSPGTPGEGWGEGLSCYSEKSVYLPDTFWCYDPLTDQPDVNPPPLEKNRFITFGCLNNFCKVTQPTISLWSKVLAEVPNSRMILLSPVGSHRAHLLRQLHVSPDRVEFVEFRPRPEYLKLYHQIDICLDTIPYNGHTTSLDAFWMGVPVITLIGKTPVGRAGLSLLRNLNLENLAARDEEQFIKIVKDLDVQRPTDLRATLRKRMQQSPLMNGPRFTSAMESAYRQMWQTWCSSQK
jgi:predicted O-linked N-acetylglucosamine transferase (SPINDLY family)